LYLDPAKDISLPKRPVVHILRECPGREPVQEDVVMDWLAPDQLQCAVLMNGKETVLPVLELPGGRRQVLAPACLPVSPEFAPVEPGKGMPALQKLAAATGGTEVMDLASIWDRLPRGTRDVPLRRGLISSALVVLMLAILQRRTGWLAPVKAAPGADSQAKVAKTEANKKSSPGVFGRRRNSAVNEQAPPVQVEEPKIEKRPPSPPATSPDTLDALRKARSQAGHLNRRE